MYRRGGFIAITLGVLLAVLFLAWPARYQTGYVRSRGEVSRVYVGCGIPWAILTDRQFGEEARTPWIREQCVRTARARLVNIAVLSVPLVLLGVTGLARGHYRRIPLAEVLHPLPKQLWWQRRHSMNEELLGDGQTEDRPEVGTGGEGPEDPPPI